MKESKEDRIKALEEEYKVKFAEADRLDAEDRKKARESGIYHLDAGQMGMGFSLIKECLLKKAAILNEPD